MKNKSTNLIYIGVDDTDNFDSRGTGRLARGLGVDLLVDFNLIGVTRHQLLVDPRVPYTSHNSSATILLEANNSTNLERLFERVKEYMLADFVQGSDPGLCISWAPVASELVDFGRRAKSELVSQQEARELAAQNDVLLVGLGGTQDGVIGALAAVGLAASGEDGRYVCIGNARELSGLIPISTILATGIQAVYTLDGQEVIEGRILADKLLPARRGGKPILYVSWDDNYWQPVKLD
jgi:tRNA(Ile2) C34 agmatinyltransferase TiaS